jgi:prepilin-type N-terminal cleavage/methylation domain-containing protein
MKRRGFTLIEMAIVIVIIGLLTSGVIAGVTPVVQSARFTQTEGRLKRIESALVLYVMENGCLPCPANGTVALGGVNAGWSATQALVYYGPGNTSGQNRPCADAACIGDAAGNGAVGILPWKTLGLGVDDAQDPWGGMITYAVAAELTRTSGTSMQRTPPAAYPAGSLLVDNTADVRQTSAAAFVVISHGRDGAFSFRTNGAQNGDNTGGTEQGSNNPAANDGTTAFVDGPQSSVRAGYFDDHVLWRTAPAIIQACGPGACGNPS